MKSVGLGNAILLLWFVIGNVNPWSGSTCPRVYKYFRSISYCRCRGWWGCLYWGYVRRTYYASETNCCPGWRHNGNQACTIPICSPPCQNGGTCVSPNNCACLDGYQGSICSGIAFCSHLKPCYPGRCYGSSSNPQCMCSEGFGGTTCNKLESDEYKPLIEMENATIAKYLYTQGIRMLYLFMTDATNSTTVDIVWTNQAEFNNMKFDIDASVDARYVFDHIPPLPSYIRNQTFGIVDANVMIEHYKLNRDGVEELFQDKTISCGGLSNTSPIADETLKCRLTNGTNLFQVDSGDRYKLTYTVTTGGYRELINTNDNSRYKADIYHGISSTSIMEFRFDRDVPVHCSESSSCFGSQPPFVLEKDVTKEPLRSSWFGWSDSLSGIVRYSFEVWKMEYSLDYNVLREPNIRPNVNPVPEFITSQDAGNTTRPIFEPAAPGVYSTILEVVDSANNSRYARRIAIFDKSSTITTRAEFPLYVISANNESNYEWQTTPNSGSTPSADITLEISWEDHFINQVHVDGNFLAKVQPFEPRLSDDIDRIDYKKIDPEFDDNEGDRTTAAIPNLNSIVKFEFKYGTENRNIPTSGWEEIPFPRQNITKLLAGETINDGDLRQIWVKAYDVMGNINVDSVVIGFDYSTPIFVDTSNSIEKNVKDGLFPFSSRVTVHAKDLHSGIKKVSFKFIVSDTGEIKSQHDFTIQTKPIGLNCPGSDCYCIAQLCYDERTVLEMNNCWLEVPINRVKNEAHDLVITVYNSAMLSSSRTLQLGTVEEFDGIQEYKSPTNIFLHELNEYGVLISWVHASSCYDRVEYIIRLYRSDNTSNEYLTPENATSFELKGLFESTDYWFELYTKYGNDTHFQLSGPSAIYQFTTSK